MPRPKIEDRFKALRASLGSYAPYFARVTGAPVPQRDLPVICNLDSARGGGNACIAVRTLHDDSRLTLSWIFCKSFVIRAAHSRVVSNVKCPITFRSLP